MSPSLQRLNVQHSFQIGPTSITFHHSENQDSFLTRIKSELETVEVFPGNPATVLEIEDAFFMPGEVCVYDKGGHRVVDSCIRRGPDLSSFAKTKKEHAVLPQEHDSFEPPIVYLSFLPNHWGHFLTEGVSRLWAFLEYPELRDFDCFFGHANFQNPSFHEFFQSCGIAPDRIKTFDRQVKIKKCYVPLPSINNRNRVFSDHKESLHAVADLMLQGDTPQYSDQAVYLSRSQFRGGPRRVLRNETELEASLSACGVRIVHPQGLELKEQIRLFNSHRVFIGSMGAAFHNLLFSLVPANIHTHVLLEHVPNMNYIMFDAMLGMNANYVQALAPTPDAPQTLYQDLSIDIDLTVDYLRHNGVI